MNVLTKEEALEKGLTFYFTGKPCKHGHISERLVKGGSCKECKNTISAKKREENREKYNKYCREKKKEHYSPEKRREMHKKNITSEMFYAAKSRAKNKNLTFTITKEDVIIPKTCPVFGIPLDSRDVFHTPSLDRIINDLGYVKGNVRVIRSKANRLINNGTIEEFKQILEYMKNG